MADIVLIHGYEVGLTGPFRPDLGPTSGFKAFAKEVASGQAVVFRWGLDRHAGLLDLLDPRLHVALYRREASIAQATETAYQLEEFLFRHRPKMVVCHSMGAVLLNHCAGVLSLPQSVREVVFVQADLPHDAELHIPVPVTNLWCPWDATLVASAVLNRKFRAGQRPLRGARNELRPVWIPQVHVQAIKKPSIRRFVLDRLAKCGAEA